MHYLGWTIDWSDWRYPSLNVPTYIFHDRQRHWKVLMKEKVSIIWGLIPDQYNWSDWLILQSLVLFSPFPWSFFWSKVLRYLPVFVFKVILIILSSTFMSCILQYSSTHRLQCILCTGWVLRLDIWWTCRLSAITCCHPITINGIYTSDIHHTYA